MPRKKHRNSAIKQNENTDQRPKSRLFSEADAKSVEVSGYTLGHGAPQFDQSMPEHLIPTGVVDIDESVVFPPLTSHSYREPDPKPYTISPTKQRHDRESVHLPSITDPPKKHYPYEYYYPQPNSYHSEYLYNSHPIHHRYQSVRHDPHHRHKHGETYDPRWWYMPINSVHGPRSQRFIHHHHYTPPKWYELPTRQ